MSFTSSYVPSSLVLLNPPLTGEKKTLVNFPWRIFLFYFFCAKMTARGKWQCAPSRGFFYIFLRMWEGQLDAEKRNSAPVVALSHISRLSFSFFSLRQNARRRRREKFLRLRVTPISLFHSLFFSSKQEGRGGEIKFSSFFPPRTSLSPLFSFRNRKGRRELDMEFSPLGKQQVAVH